MIPLDFFSVLSYFLIITISNCIFLYLLQIFFVYEVDKLNLQSMDYIITTANEKSISRAAEILHITQQTLSAHISSVERELGCKLFIRHVPLEITYAGKEFLKYAVNIQQQVNALRRTFDEIAGEEKGLLRIGVTDNRDRIVLLPIIVRFQQEHPKIQIKVIENTNDVLIQQLVKGEIDVCISDFSTHQREITQVDLYRERVVFVVPKSLFLNIYSGHADDVIRSIQQDADYKLLQDCPLLFGHEQDIAGKFSRKLIKTFEHPPIIAVEAENMALVLGLCAEGLGGCFCPEIIARNTLSDEQLQKVLIITLGKQSEYNIRLGWKNKWSVTDSFVKTACEQVKLLNAATNRDY